MKSAMPSVLLPQGEFFINMKRGTTCAALLCMLCACSDTHDYLPHVFGSNEVPPQIIAEPRLVPIPTSDENTSGNWPRLGDVPSKPKNFTSQTLINETKQELEDERATGEAVHQRYAPNLAASKSAQ